MRLIFWIVAAIVALGAFMASGIGGAAVVLIFAAILAPFLR